MEWAQTYKRMRGGFETDLNYYDRRNLFRNVLGRSESQSTQISAELSTRTLLKEAKIFQ
jgi:hypothetical protein